MRFIKKLIVAVAIVAGACQTTKDSREETAIGNDTLSTRQEVVSSDGAADESVEKPKEWEAFQRIFTYPDNDVKQTLGVIDLTADSIEFRLSTENGLCDTQYWGQAKNHHADGDPELDEDEEALSYPANEFTFENEHQIISIRIALAKDKARVNFTDKTNEETDCIPTPGLLLKDAENAR